MYHKELHDPMVTKAMDVIFAWNLRVGRNTGHGFFYARPSVNEVQSMATEMLNALGVDYDRRA